MKSKYLIFLWSIILFSCATDADKTHKVKTFSVVELGDSVQCSEIKGLKLNDGDTVPRDYKGIIFWCHNNGFLNAIAEISYGKEHGISKTYYSNGKFSSIANYFEGKKHGSVTAYFENGQKEIEQHYKNGLKNGKQVIYYENGNVKMVSYFINGLTEGEFKTFYENGSPQSIMYMVKGKPVQSKNRYFDETKSTNNIQPILLNGADFEIYPYSITRPNGEVKHTGWFNAIEDCKDLGDGWRLPTLVELQFMFSRKNEIGGLAHMGNSYWSSTPVEGASGFYWSLDFDDSNEKKCLTNQPCCIRPVRDK